MQANELVKIEDKIASHYRAIASYPDSQKWFIALSGGADSTALLHLLVGPAKACGASLHALIVNHNLRPEAHHEAQMVVKRCAAQGFDAEILNVRDTPPKGARQEWARARRYDLLCGYARRHGGVLWFAHHLDDQCETIAMRLSHDSGLAGLGGMKEVVTAQFVPVLRPLLDIPKQSLIEFCKAHALEFVSDPSNENEAFERVRWRKCLAQEKALSGQLARLGRASRSLESHLWSAFDGFMAKHIAYDSSGDSSGDGFGIRVNHKAFFSLPIPAQMVILRDLLGKVGAGGYPASHPATLRMLARLSDFKDGTLASCLLRCQGKDIHIMPEAGRGHRPFLLGANQEHLYQGRFIIRTPCDVMIAPMTLAHIVAFDENNSYGAALRQMAPHLRMIFPYLHALDGTPITPHIKDKVSVGYFGQMVWPNEQVEIHPLGTIANG